MPDPTQPSATTTAARVLRDSEIEFLRSDYAEWVVTEFDPDVILRLLATLDAAHTRAVEAEQQRDKWESIAGEYAKGAETAYRVASEDRQRAEQAEQFGAKRATDYERRLEQARLAEHELIGRLERAEAALALAEIKRQQWYEQSELYFRSLEGQRQARERAEDLADHVAGDRDDALENLERAEAALAMAEGERDHWRMVAERTVADLTEERELRDFYQSQAAPHEPPQGDG